MKTFWFLGVLALATPLVPAYAADGSSCSSVSQDKKLVGAAKTSFMARCKADTAARCDQIAADKKLYGAARSSFTNKCVNDGVG